MAGVSSWAVRLLLALGHSRLAQISTQLFPYLKIHSQGYYWCRTDLGIKRRNRHRPFTSQIVSRLGLRLKHLGSRSPRSAGRDILGALGACGWLWRMVHLQAAFSGWSCSDFLLNCQCGLERVWRSRSSATSTRQRVSLLRNLPRGTTSFSRHSGPGGDATARDTAFRCGRVVPWRFRSNL